jgi:hypothetical protein
VSTNPHALEAIIDRLEAGLPVTVYVLAEPPSPCLKPTCKGTVGYVNGCRCPRCRAAWREYGRGYKRGLRLPMGRPRRE